jgi:hypothetical protein
MCQWWHLSLQETKILLKVSGTVRGIVVPDYLTTRTQVMFSQSGNATVKELFKMNVNNGIFCI